MATDTSIRCDRFYIGGVWVDPGTGDTHDVINAATEERIASIPLGTADDVDRAVTAARAGFDIWSQSDIPARAAVLAAIAAALEARGDELAALIASEMGMPIAQSRFIQAGLPAMTFGSMARIVGQFPWEEELGNSKIVREPIGVVAAITPWNYPLHQVAAKVAPAIAAGCAIVLKPSEITPLSAFVLAEIIDDVGLPAGVFNLVTGTGPVVGEALAAHGGVDMVSLTGSTRSGRRVGAVAAETFKRTSLELGGKSAFVILDDADLMQAVPHGVEQCMLNSGQTCSALTRMLVPRERLAEAEAIAAAAVDTVTLGDPFEADTTLGPMVTAAHRDRVLDYIRTGIAEGARVVIGGPEPVEGLDHGWFVRPTVFSDVTPDMTIAREEIFGPVLVLLACDDEEHAIAIANDSPYGLSGGVWSTDRARAERVARRLRTGQVAINNAAFNPLAPFGGYKQSGRGRELGPHGLVEFTETKAIQL